MTRDERSIKTRLERRPFAARDLALKVILERGQEALTGTSTRNMLLVAAAVLLALISGLWLARHSGNDSNRSIPTRLLSDLHSDQTLLRMASVHELEGLEGSRPATVDDLLIEALAGRSLR